MDRRTVALGIAAAAAAAAAVIVTVANGRGTSPRYEATAAYIKSVDSVQQQMRVELTKATNAYRDFAGGKIRAALEPELEGAVRTLRKLERRLVALPAPPIAARLKQTLVKLAASEVALAGEVDELATFAPAFSSLLRRSNAASAELSRALAAVKPPKPHAIRGTQKQVAAAQAKFSADAAHAAALQAHAVDVYDAKVAHVQSELRALRPPAVMQPAYRVQLRTFAGLRTAGKALAQELRQSNRSGVASVGRRFTIAERGATSVASQQAEIAAVKTYNGRVRAIGSLQARIRDELARLQRVVG